MCVNVCLGSTMSIWGYAHMTVAVHDSKKKVADSLDLELQSYRPFIVNHALWVLETEFGASRRIVHGFKY